jgi:nitroimidazol reductase NimA-like FMN-containing flavoprotein (pyridoxamine 5'-phosphate oxidase superfamily)
MMKFTSNETAFLNKNEVCRLATASRDARPHVIPVCYIFREGHFYIVTDYDTKKYKNVLENPKVALVVDVYSPHKAIAVKGEVDILERGEEFRRVSDLFYKKFDWARKDPWKEGESPILKIKPLKKASWGL